MSNIARSGCLAAMPILLFCVTLTDGGQNKSAAAVYKALNPVTEGNLTIFPIVTESTFDTHNFLTLDEGLRSGQVVVTEEGGTAGLVRPRTAQPPVVWQEHPQSGPRRGAEVNQLVLTNNSDRPLILLAGEIVTGGKQDRVVGKDRLVPAKGDPIDLGVFCVEPHRWVETSARFGGLGFAMAQPSIRLKAMAEKDQQAVWDQVAQSRESVADVVSPSAAAAIHATSSYAKTMENGALQQRMEAVVAPIERTYEKLIHELRAQKAVGAVVAVNGEIVWADAFASTSLLEKYWPKLVRSYAAEAVSSGLGRVTWRSTPSTAAAQSFLDDFQARRESVESEPGVYRNTELIGSGFDAFLLTSLLPGTGFNVHVAKMKQ
jgi:sulfur carrier protein ThiS